MMKKTLSLLLALLMLLMLLPLASCGEKKSSQTDTTNPDVTTPSSSDTTEEDTTPTETTEWIPDSLEEQNFDGAAFKIFGTDDRTSFTVTAEETSSNVVTAAQFESRMNVESRFGCTISYETILTDVGVLFQQLNATNDDSYQVGFAPDYSMLDIRTSGLSYNLSNIEQFDFDAPWWTNGTDLLSISGQRRVASSFLSYTCLYYARIVLINKGMAEELQLTVPYEDVFAGEWYLDDMIEMATVASRDIDGDGNTDIYGWTTSESVIYTFQSSLDVNFIVKDENDNPVFNENALERATVFMEKMSPLAGLHVLKSGNVGYGNGELASGQTLFCYCNMREIVTEPLVSSDIAYGFLPAPKLDELQEDYITSATDVYWGIPLPAAKSPDFVGTVIEALQCQHYNLVRPAFFNTTMRMRMAESPDDSRVLDLIPPTLTLDLDYAYGLSVANLLQNSSIDKLSSTVNKYAKSIKKQMSSLVARLNELES